MGFRAHKFVRITYPRTPGYDATTAQSWAGILYDDGLIMTVKVFNFDTTPTPVAPELVRTDTLISRFASFAPIPPGGGNLASNLFSRDGVSACSLDWSPTKPPWPAIASRSSIYYRVEVPDGVAPAAIGNAICSIVSVSAVLPRSPRAGSVFYAWG